MTSTSLVWFRNDLRLDDHPALRAAIDRKAPVIPVFIWAPDEEGKWRPGEASDWWLHQSLKSLDASLRKLGSSLIIRSGDSLANLQQLIQETNAEAVFWNRRYEPAFVHRDKHIKSTLRKQDLIADSFNGHLMYEPWDVQTKEGRPYQVFTSFWRTCREKSPADPLPSPKHISAPHKWPHSLSIDSLGLEPNRPWIQGLADAWEPGENHARKKLQAFLSEAVADYETARDLPADAGTSRLSPHLHFGEISPRTVWQAIQAQRSKQSNGTANQGLDTYLKELGWREFAHHLLYHFPKTTDHPLRPEFEKFPWEENKSWLRAWQRGQTGYPIVDAGMRELWKTGWMHNRVRMIVASFLVKDLRLNWRQGALWFWDTLLDADLANNTLGWQWSAGCGADAAPYFRVFNPVLQSEKFDRDGRYIRCWVPEIASLPDKWLHSPWAAPRDILQSAGITLGKTYPAPLVDHSEARKLALEAFQHVKRS